MFYIKVEDRALIPTITEPVYRGENLNQKIRFLIPHTVDDVDIATSLLYLCYVRADGVADIEVLTKDPVDYSDTYYQFAVPVDCKLTRFAGEVCMWINIYNGDASKPAIAKTNEYILRVQDSKNMDDYLCDHQLTALYQIHKSLNDSMKDTEERVNDTMKTMEDTVTDNIQKVNEAMDKLADDVDEDIAAVQADVKKRANSLTYDEKYRKLQLLADDEKIGTEVTVPGDNYGSETDDEWTDMTTPGEGEGDTYWEDM